MDAYRRLHGMAYAHEVTLFGQAIHVHEFPKEVRRISRILYLVPSNKLQFVEFLL